MVKTMPVLGGFTSDEGYKGFSHHTDQKNGYLHILDPEVGSVGQIIIIFSFLFFLCPSPHFSMI